MPEGLSVTLVHYLAVSGLIFGLGTGVALSKRNAVAVLMGVELMLNAVNLTLLAFSRFSSAFAEGEEPLAGHVFVVFVLTVAAAEAAVALAMAVLVYRQRETVDLDRVNLLRG
ncbi:MAG: NADH-quinone oxidoreductase subunit NuoK [Dehalococcoidia bacterium]